MLHIEKLTGLMGAEVSGIDLSQDITDKAAESLRQALADYQMIAIRG